MKEQHEIIWGTGTDVDPEHLDIIVRATLSVMGVTTPTSVKAITPTKVIALNIE